MSNVIVVIGPGSIEWPVGPRYDEWVGEDYDGKLDRCAAQEKDRLFDLIARLGRYRVLTHLVVGLA
jgi:hypothetical protein